MKKLKENKEREVIQAEALKALKDNNFTGTVCLSTGTGKSKVAVDCMKEGNFKNILITTPRINLKASWEHQLELWGYFGNVTIENIQSVYKWETSDLAKFDLIIVDEIHFIGPEYIRYIDIANYINIPVIGLTATPNLKDLFKSEVLYKSVPIVYEYYNSEQDSIINKVNYFVLMYTLNDSYKVLEGTKNRSWLTGEKKAYDYYNKVMEDSSNEIKDHYWKSIKKRTFYKLLEDGLTSEDKSFLRDAISKDIENFNEAVNRRFELRDMSNRLYGAVKDIRGYNYFWLGTKASRHLASKDTPYPVKDLIRKYMWAMNKRKTLLWSLNSSLIMALEAKEKILTANPNNKVLLFSELTEQAEKLSDYSIHSNNGSTAKTIKENNKNLLNKFNLGEIRELSSCMSLTLGLNMSHANWAIFESFSGSDVNSKQKKGRLNRLPVDDVANVLVILPIQTQAEVWFEKAFDWVEDFTVIKSLDELPLWE